LGTAFFLIYIVASLQKPEDNAAFKLIKTTENAVLGGNHKRVALKVPV